MPRGWTWPPSEAMRDAGARCVEALEAEGVGFARAKATKRIVTPIVLDRLELGAIELQPTWRKPPFVMDCHLALALHAMDTGMDTGEVAAIDAEMLRVGREEESEERERRLGLLERKKRSLGELRDRREQVQRHFESCVLAMQNVRYDLLRLKSAGVNAVLGDLTQATQQARALSRDVDGVIAAADEIRDLV